MAKKTTAQTKREASISPSEMTIDAADSRIIPNAFSIIRDIDGSNNNLFNIRITDKIDNLKEYNEKYKYANFKNMINYFNGILGTQNTEFIIIRNIFRNENWCELKAIIIDFINYNDEIISGGSPPRTRRTVKKTRTLQDTINSLSDKDWSLSDKEKTYVKQKIDELKADPRYYYGGPDGKDAKNNRPFYSSDYSPYEKAKLEHVKALKKEELVNLSPKHKNVYKMFEEINNYGNVDTMEIEGFSDIAEEVKLKLIGIRQFIDNWNFQAGSSNTKAVSSVFEYVLILCDSSPNPEDIENAIYFINKSTSRLPITYSNSYNELIRDTNKVQELWNCLEYPKRSKGAIYKFGTLISRKLYNFISLHTDFSDQETKIPIYPISLLNPILRTRILGIFGSSFIDKIIKDSKLKNISSDREDSNNSATDKCLRICYLCGNDISYDHTGAKQKKALDHIIPVIPAFISGIINCPFNFVNVHAKCNGKKSDHLPHFKTELDSGSAIYNIIENMKEGGAGLYAPVRSKVQLPSNISAIQNSKQKPLAAIQQPIRQQNKLVNNFAALSIHRKSQPLSMQQHHDIFPISESNSKYKKISPKTIIKNINILIESFTAENQKIYHDDNYNSTNLIIYYINTQMIDFYNLIKAIYIDKFQLNQQSGGGPAEINIDLVIKNYLNDNYFRIDNINKNWSEKDRISFYQARCFLMYQYSLFDQQYQYIKNYPVYIQDRKNKLIQTVDAYQALFNTELIG